MEETAYLDYIRQLRILLAFEREEIGETQACKLLGMYRVEFRGWAHDQYTRAATTVAEEQAKLKATTTPKGYPHDKDS